MTSPAALVSVGFNLDPTGKYKHFRLAAEAYAGTLCTELYDQGLASVPICIHMTEVEYRERYTPEVAVNTRATAAQALLGEKKIPSRPVQAADADSTALAVFRLKKDDYLIYASGYQKFRNALLDGIGNKMQLQMATVAKPITNYNVDDILSYIKGKYGTVKPKDVKALKAKLKRPCQSDSETFNYASEMVQIFEELAEQRAEVGEFDKMEYMEDGTRHLYATGMAVRDYIRENPKLENRTFTAMISFVEEVLPNHDNDQSGTQSGIQSGFGAKTLPTPDATVVELRATIADLMNENKILKSKAHVPMVKQYCWKHGARFHLGIDCKDMGPGSKHTDAHRKATGPIMIDGVAGKA